MFESENLFSNTPINKRVCYFLFSLNQYCFLTFERPAVEWGSRIQYNTISIKCYSLEPESFSEKEKRRRSSRSGGSPCPEKTWVNKNWPILNMLVDMWDRFRKWEKPEYLDKSVKMYRRRREQNKPFLTKSPYNLSRWNWRSGYVLKNWPIQAFLTSERLER